MTTHSVSDEAVHQIPFHMFKGIMKKVLTVSVEEADDAIVFSYKVLGSNTNTITVYLEKSHDLYFDVVGRSSLVNFLNTFTNVHAIEVSNNHVQIEISYSPLDEEPETFIFDLRLGSVGALEIYSHSATGVWFSPNEVAAVLELAKKSEVLAANSNRIMNIVESNNPVNPSMQGIAEIIIFTTATMLITLVYGPLVAYSAFLIELIVYMIIRRFFKI